MLLEGILQPANLVVFGVVLCLGLGILYLAVRVIRAAWGKEK